MKNAKKLGLSVASFGAATLCLVGGTFAWYVVSNTGTATSIPTIPKALPNNRIEANTQKLFNPVLDPQSFGSIK